MRYDPACILLCGLDIFQSKIDDELLVLERSHILEGSHILVVRSF
jgi:hypothetical protein